MAVTVDCADEPDSVSPITLDEYVDWVTHNVDITDLASIVESAPKLHMLSKNKSLLLDTVAGSIKMMASSALQPTNPYTDVTFLLYDGIRGGHGSTFAVRANIWDVPQLRGGSADYEERLYLYFDTHDHNFDFLTVGYYGPGYRTKIYEYDRSTVDGSVGERVAMRFTEETSLPEGKVMLYRHGRDIHTQLPPESMSISLNLLVANATLQRYSQQYRFDAGTGTIIGYVDGLSSERMSLMKLAGEIGNEGTAEVLEQIAHTHPCALTRAEAYRSFVKLVPSEIDSARVAVAADRSALVRGCGV